MTTTEIQIETETLKRENDAIEELLKERNRRMELEALLDDRYESMVALARRVARAFGVHVKDLTGNRRLEKLVIPRQAAMSIMYESFDDISLEDVGEFFGGRDHGTVMHAIKANKDRCDTTPWVKSKVELIRAITNAHKSA